MIERLHALALDESASLRTYRRLAQEITDPAAGVVLGLLVRDAEQDGTLLRRMLAGALDQLNRVRSSAQHGQPRAVASDRAIAEINALSHAAGSRAQLFRDLACAERGLDHHALAMLLDGMAGDHDKHARLLAQLGRHLAALDRGASNSNTTRMQRVNGQTLSRGVGLHHPDRRRAFDGVASS